MVLEEKLPQIWLTLTLRVLSFKKDFSDLLIKEKKKDFSDLWLLGLKGVV